MFYTLSGLEVVGRSSRGTYPGIAPSIAWHGIKAGVPVYHSY